MKGAAEQNIETARQILADEIRGDVQAALAKMAQMYSMTWVYKAPKSGDLFPVSRPDFEAEMKEVYAIEGRRYDIRNIAGSEEVVMVELVESYPAEDGGEYRTPLVIVLEFGADGKILRGRHYCDPNLSYLKLSEVEVEKAFQA